MRLLRLGPYIAGALASAALLAGCSAGGSQPSALGSTALSSARQGAYPNRGAAWLGQHIAAFSRTAALRAHPKSWVSPNVKDLPRLLYISDPSSLAIQVLTMPALQPKATITTGFTDPAGMCSDRSGNIWVADVSGVKLVQYNARTSGTGPLQSLDDTTGFPISCAVNSVNGDIAVGNVFGLVGNGNVAIYKGGVAPPDQELTDPDMAIVEFVGYDGSGNLFVSGADSTGSSPRLRC